MNILVFLIPAESGEKISYAITVLLTFAVYLSVYSDKIPPLSLPIPIFSVSLLIKLSSSCLIAFCCIIISKISHYGYDRRVPLRLQQFVACFRRNRKVGGLTKKPSKKEKDYEINCVTDVIDRETSSLSQEVNLQENLSPMEVGWKDVARLLDRLCLGLFTVSATVETVLSLMLILMR
ncbi:neuronal acetylcholine receptor subunit beta-3-like [Argopecten irradians]|uniref:neuronal acetylcholine receptor subunit beta-3-like n=1 Tax=Argopecten irradians TaxID=31199 RepID=UPI00371432A1